MATRLFRPLNQLLKSVRSRRSGNYSFPTSSRQADSPHTTRGLTTIPQRSKALPLADCSMLRSYVTSTMTQNPVVDNPFKSGGTNCARRFTNLEIDEEQAFDIFLGLLNEQQTPGVCVAAETAAFFIEFPEALPLLESQVNKIYGPTRLKIINNLYAQQDTIFEAENEKLQIKSPDIFANEDIQHMFSLLRLEAKTSLKALSMYMTFSRELCIEPNKLLALCPAMIQLYPQQRNKFHLIESHPLIRSLNKMSEESLSHFSEQFAAIHRQRKEPFLIGASLIVEFNIWAKDVGMSAEEIKHYNPHLKSLFLETLLNKDLKQNIRLGLAKDLWNTFKDDRSILFKALLHFSKPFTYQDCEKALKEFTVETQDKIKPLLDLRAQASKPPLLNLPTQAKWNPLRTLQKSMRDVRVSNLTFIISYAKKGLFNEFKKAVEEGSLDDLRSSHHIISSLFPKEDLSKICKKIDNNLHWLMFIHTLKSENNQNIFTFVQAIRAAEDGTFEEFREECDSKALLPLDKHPGKTTWLKPHQWELHEILPIPEEDPLGDNAYQVSSPRDFDSLMHWTNASHSCLNLMTGFASGMFAGFLFNPAINPIYVTKANVKKPNQPPIILGRANLMVMNSEAGPVLMLEQPYYNCSSDEYSKAVKGLVGGAIELAKRCQLPLLGYTANVSTYPPITLSAEMNLKRGFRTDMYNTYSGKTPVYSALIKKMYLIYKPDGLDLSEWLD